MFHLHPRLRPRLVSSALAAVLVFGVLPGDWTVNTRLLAAWDVGVLLYLAATGFMMMRATRDNIMARAKVEDDGAVAVLAMTLAAALASLAAIALELHGVRDAQPAQSTLRIGLAGLTILCSWFFVHTIYAVHYAHEFYGGDGEERRGLKFPEEEAPVYGEFLYFSFNMGAAAQTSDVTVVSRRMRRLVLAHTILAFLFNTTILALAINVAASLI
ncbi:DUF1345 domain-containing protein [Microvirga pudoricolor]|uniref:DUF1345 domain-containing protein n=1 Tax=Microvirga pudoricolor TaxID=2778729 RepID=UPI001950F9B7|nr:DUF1345 domain-containing protein [Microvirga pudoricolor]MBM6593800.1 DUF1345 domain-containing protein [Microvirga pudoricolor]